MTEVVAAGWKDAAAIARAGDWARWPGLPSGLTVAAVVDELSAQPQAQAATALPARQPAPPAMALPAPVAARLGPRSLDRYDVAPLRVWADGPTVVLVEWLDPPSASPAAALLAALGPADREAAGRHLRSGATTTEHVYAGRGLALTVAASYDQPPGFAPYLATAQLFPPGSLRDFVLERGGNDQPGPRPIDPRRR